MEASLPAKTSTSLCSVIVKSSFPSALLVWMVYLGTAKLTQEGFSTTFMRRVLEFPTFQRVEWLLESYSVLRLVVRRF